MAPPAGALEAVKATRGLASALRAVDRGLRAAGAPYMVIGGIGVVARGVPRTTRDIDATTPGGAISSDALLQALAEAGIEPRIADVAAFAATTSVLLLRHVRTGIDVDLTLAWSPFELEALAAAETVRVGGVSVPIARAEDLVVYKVIGGRPVDLADIDELLVLHARSMDLDRVRALAAEVAEALDDPGRLDRLLAALRRVS